jgi:hypothetical protein
MTGTPEIRSGPRAALSNIRRSASNSGAGRIHRRSPLGCQVGLVATTAALRWSCSERTGRLSLQSGLQALFSRRLMFSCGHSFCSCSASTDGASGPPLGVPLMLDMFVRSGRDSVRYILRPITSLKPITADSKHGCGRCADSRDCAQRRQSRPAMPSCRTSDEATTSSRPISPPTTGSASRSTNSPTAYDRKPPGPPPDSGASRARPTQQCPSGLSNIEIATRLFVSEAPLKTHINRIFAKTGRRDRAQAVAYAHRHRPAD